MSVEINTASDSATRIIVFQEGGSGEKKIAGIRQFGREIRIVQVFDIDQPLPEYIEEPRNYLCDHFEGELVLSFLKHPDLIEHLAQICREKQVPLIAAGKSVKGAITPFTCCGLSRRQGLGNYGEQFGLPEYEIEAEHGRVVRVGVLRGASCGATWLALARIVGLPAEEALSRVAREVQYHCQADPSAFDPISGKSALHFAGEVHARALQCALNGTS